MTDLVQVYDAIQGLPGDSALPAPYTANISGAYTIDASRPVQKLTVTGDVAVTLPEPPEGKTVGLSVKIIQDETGHAVTIPSGTTDVQCTWGESVPPDIATTPNSRHSLYFVSDPDEGIWDGYVSALNQGMSS